MRLLRLSIVMSFAVLASLLVIVSPAGASPSTSQTIVLTRDANLHPSGWNAYGTFVDSGSWTADSGAFAPDSAPLFVGTLKTTETSSAGTLSLSFTVLTSPSPTGVFGGNCQLTGGTGAYAGYQGTGTWLFSTDGTTRYYTCSLRVHQDP